MKSSIVIETIVPVVQEAAPIEETKKEEKAVTRTAVDETGWSEEEIALLMKALLKFPPGTGQRWKTIAQYCC